MHIKERIFWVLVAISTIVVAWFGYQRFREIRPDIFDPTYTTAGQPSEQERLERIKAYQEKSSGLTWGRDQVKLGPNQQCVDGFVIEVEKKDGSVSAQRVLRDGKPVACGDD